MSFQITFVAFPGVTQLDLTAPAQVLARLPEAEVAVVATSPEPLATGCGFAIVPSHTPETAPPADLICVPGGAGVADAVRDDGLTAFLRRQADHARYVTSVCTGAFLLGAAGLLQGRDATTHWAYTDLLPLVGARHRPGRVVVDGAVITGGGVTAGLDFALTVVAEVAGPQVAQTIQLSLEYTPAPPFTAGDPQTAPPAVRAGVAPWYDGANARLRTALETVAASAP